MEHATEQADEVEALESIYCGFFDMLSEGAPYKFRVAVDPEAAQEREGNSAQPVRLEITFPETYPEVVPEIEVRYSHILPKHATALKQHLEAEAQNLLGCAMVFNLVTAAKEWLESNNLSAAQDWGAYEEEEEEDESKKRNKVSFLLCSWPKMTKTQSGILKGVVGVTPVNPDNFLAWRTKFEAEIEAQRQAEETGHRTVTGRQLFERDASLYMDTDVGFNDASLFEDEEFPDEEEEDDEDEDEEDEDEEGAGIDESLFQTLDDDLPDSESDDPDFEPGK